MIHRWARSRYVIRVVVHKAPKYAAYEPTLIECPAHEFIDIHLRLVFELFEMYMKLYSFFEFRNYLLYAHMKGES